ncbi:hypothetical protein ASPWEDRAFT_305855 [Aspergillus wentii DTO 134E9]|uniref:Uncharacterized protein n=1 Tax=Aspergillus wentii DTO 134E9 TaxID=1073089 RepID=A0A1L9R3V2_ASPWE|nr:uncharacterized protein ASPWEDRAFT_305855 [Aspergillus wentii DTO 134E9]KAI9925377.1 hypothetical protein MW887_006305 [Aspergillus wentii]OJJ29596.1 hypothetical protein ASPWEDRAFT_305855 [Aspergillus wentii DTO 134E9]
MENKVPPSRPSTPTAAYNHVVGSTIPVDMIDLSPRSMMKSNPRKRARSPTNEGPAVLAAKRLKRELELTPMNGQTNAYYSARPQRALLFPDQGLTPISEQWQSRADQTLTEGPQASGLILDLLQGSSRRNAVARLMPSPFPQHTREEEERLFNEMAHWYKQDVYFTCENTLWSFLNWVRFRLQMWSPVASMMGIRWEQAEDLSWQMGRAELGRRMALDRSSTDGQ